MKVILLLVILIGGVFCARQESRDVCLQPMKTGPCEAAFRRYFYNYETKKCDIFIYGGCQSNGNNFKSKEECRRTCIPNL